MDVVYFFRKSAGVRVPFFDYDRNLFYLFVRGGGFWDKARREFLFKGDAGAGQLREVFLTVPCVWVEEDSSGQSRIFGFLDRPWENALNVSPVIKSKKNRSGRRDAFLLHDKLTCYFTDSPIHTSSDHPFYFPVHVSLPEKLSEHWLSKLDAALRSRKYSPRTQKAYIYYNRLICRTLQKTPEEITSNDVTEFIANMEKSKDYSASSMNLAISAIKFFFRNVLRKDEISEQHRPRHDERLPIVLSKEEIKKVLNLEKNPKHRLLLMLVYSSGLRVSEVVALKKEHIDLSRKVIYVRLGKGRKDRNTLLSEKAAGYIEEYYNFFDIQKWLFPGQPVTRHLTIRSAQHIFDKAISRAGIMKKITIHGLRHTFATHLLESGTDIRYIQTLLGHVSICTTERYTHIAKRNVLSIKSPLDTIL
jgi:site-specific recombinase XerD